MKQDHLLTALFGGGMLLLLVSFVWPIAVGGKRAYTDDDAAEYRQASAGLHDAIHRESHKQKHSKKDDAHPSIDAARKRFRDAQAKRDEAVVRGTTTAAVSKWLGVFCLAASLVVYLVIRRRESQGV